MDGSTEQAATARVPPMGGGAEPATPAASVGAAGRAVQAARLAAGVGLGLLLAGALAAALVFGGLFVVPTVGAAEAPAASPPRRPPIVPPSVPLGVREDWAIWTYVEKINQAWGKDWPLVIEWFEELYARYPHNEMVQDKLYAAYVEDGRTLQFSGDPAGARRRYEQAASFDPDRGEAWEFLKQLDRAGR